MKILVAMSGGVDSSIVSYKLKNLGHDVEGVYMILHQNDKYHNLNIANIKKISQFLDIKYHIVDFSQKFKQEIIDYFANEYKNGLTPNPCVMCNKIIKLGELVKFAKENGFDKLATGHYANIKNGYIYEAKDKSKDQSYFLSQIDKDVIEYLLFPLGDSLKEEILKEAQEIDILQAIATQKESNEICFVDNTYIDILNNYYDTNIKGKVLNRKGEIIGEHRGYMQYTIGKRKGFNVKGALTPHYVLKINSNDNTIVVGEKQELEIDSFIVRDITFFDKNKDFDCEVKIRYRTKKIKCRVKIENKVAIIKTYELISALAPGQVAVFYDKENIIGSGWIVDDLAK